MERITTPSGITLSYEKSGSGPPLVLVHGTLSDHNFAWVLVKPLFQPQFAVYAVARRGRGQTTATEGQTIPDEAADIVALIDAIGEPVFLLGHSLGAHISVAAAALAPEKIRKLVLYEPPLAGSDNPRADRFARVQELADQGDYDAMIDEFFRNVIRVPGQQVDLIRTTPVWPLIVVDAQNSIREWPALLNHEFDPERFRSIKVPVLLLTGADSPQEQYATRALTATLPNARVVEIPGQGHIAQAFAPQVFADTVTSFLLENR
jgi:pimeloyl-ACP methyl ester carboxylesterase